MLHSLKTSASLALLIAWYLAALPIAAQTQPEITFGAISVLTGEGASWGVNHQRGIMLAVEEWNQRGGILGRPIAVHFEDSSGGLARNALSAYHRLRAAHGLRYLLGPVNMDEMLAVVPLAKRDGVFVVAATHLSDAPDNFFSTWIDAEVEAQRIAQFMAERHRTIAILSSQQSWELEVSRHIKNHMKKSGGSIVAIEEPSFEAPEVRSEVLRTKMRRPDAIFISSYYLLPRYLKEIYAQGLRVPVYSIELDQAIISASPQSAAAGLTFIAPQTPKSDFILRFRKRWQASPDIPAASSYDSAQILFQHIEKAGGDRKRVAELYRNFSEHQGVSGMIRREGGKTIVDTAMYEVRSGVIQKKNLD